MVEEGNDEEFSIYKALEFVNTQNIFENAKFPGRRVRKNEHT